MGMNKSFYDWFVWLQEVEGVQSMLKANPKDPTNREKDFLVLFGNTFDIKGQLKSMGFRYFNGTWSIPRGMLNDMRVSQLQELGVDLSPLEGEAIGATPTAAVPAAPAGPQTPADKMLDDMERQLRDAGDKIKGKGTQSARVKGMFEFISDTIEKLGDQVDEAAKSEFVKRFLAFSSKFHHYSFYNQMLIYIQNPQATYVNSEQRWLKLGRVIDSSKWKLGPREGGPITIVAPRKGKKKAEQPQQPAEPDTIMEPEEQSYVYFAPVRTWDISSTTVIPGQEDKAKVFEPNDWKLDTNDNREEITVLANAALEYAKDQGIDVSYEELAAGKGGYSAGGKVVINNTYDGINKFSTLVHELAHETLHHNVKRDERMKTSAEQREHDAESTAYVVLQYYGFETKDAARYLALWKGDKESIRLRANHITKAAGEIIQGIGKQMEKLDIDFGDEDETPLPPATAAA